MRFTIFVVLFFTGAVKFAPKPFEVCLLSPLLTLLLPPGATKFAPKPVEGFTYPSEVKDGVYELFEYPPPEFLLLELDSRDENLPSPLEKVRLFTDFTALLNVLLSGEYSE